MSSPAPNGTDRSKPDPLASLIARIPDLQNRESYAALVSYIQSLPPTDELVKVAQLFGFLTLMGQQLPDAIAAAQKEAIDALSGAYHELQQEIKINEDLHQQLHQRLSKLPDEITAGVKPAAIAKAMSESFRQQIVATGIQDTSRFLNDATRDLKHLTAELDAAVRPVLSRYKDLATEVGNKLSSIILATDKLKMAAYDVDLENKELQQQIRKWQGALLPGLVFLFFLIGGIGGALWQQRHVTAALADLQEQVRQLQQTMKSTPTAQVPPPAKKQKKNN